MYEDLINKLRQEITTSDYDRDLLSFRLNNLNSSRNLSEEIKRIILKVNELYKTRRFPKNIEVGALLGLISFLNMIKNYDEYSLESFFFLGFYLTDYDKDELESFVKAVIPPKVINILSFKIDNLYEASSYLDYYLEKDNEMAYDLEKMSRTEIRKKTGFKENESFDRRYLYETRRI